MVIMKSLLLILTLPGYNLVGICLLTCIVFTIILDKAYIYNYRNG